MAAKIIFQDPIYQYPNRYQFTDLGGGMYEIQASPGAITQEGTLLSANNLNALSDEVFFYVLDNSNTVNAIATSITNLSGYYPGLKLIAKANNTNTGSCTININNIGNVAIKKINSSGIKINLQSNDIIKNKYEILIYDGIDFVLFNPNADITTVINDLDNLESTVAGLQNDLLAVKDKVVYFALTTGSNNAYVVNLENVTSLYAGLQINFVSNFTNTSSATLTINSLTAKTIRFNGLNLSGGEIENGETYTVIYNGVDFQLQPSASQLAAKTTILTASGTANAITLNVTLEDKSKYSFKAIADSTGAVTINGIALKKADGNVASNLKANRVYDFYYDQAQNSVFILAKAEGDATVGDVLAGKTFSNGDESGLVGTMPNNGSITITPNGNSQVIPLGYHDGTGIVNPNAVIASDNALNTLPIYQSYTSATSPEKLGEVKILGIGGSIRVKFDLKCAFSASGIAYARIYINGVAKGTLRSVSSTTYTTFVEDFTGIKDGDIVSIYAYVNYTSPQPSAYVQNSFITGTITTISFVRP